MFKMVPLKFFSLIHTYVNCKVNGSQASRPTDAMEDDGHVGHTWHFAYSTPGPCYGSKRKHFCNEDKLKIKVRKRVQMLTPDLESTRIKHVKYFCDRCLSLSGNYIAKRTVCLLFLVLLDIYVGLTRVSHHLMSLPNNSPLQSPLDFMF